MYIDVILVACMADLILFNDYLKTRLLYYGYELHVNVSGSLVYRCGTAIL